MSFWETAGKVLGAIKQEADKKQVQMTKDRQRELKKHERKITNAETSERMNDPEYQKKVEKAKQNLENVKRKVHSNEGKGRALLKNISDSRKYKNNPGVYILRLSGQIMKVGSAEIGIQKRMQQYYAMNSHCGLNKYINVENRESVSVTWQYCPVHKCEELESKLFDKYGDIEKMPWADKRPRCTDDTVDLII